MEKHTSKVSTFRSQMLQMLLKNVPVVFGKQILYQIHFLSGDSLTTREYSSNGKIITNDSPKTLSFNYIYIINIYTVDIYMISLLKIVKKTGNGFFFPCVDYCPSVMFQKYFDHL